MNRQEQTTVVKNEADNTTSTIRTYSDNIKIEFTKGEK